MEGNNSLGRLLFVSLPIVCSSAPLLRPHPPTLFINKNIGKQISYLPNRSKHLFLCKFLNLFIGCLPNDDIHFNLYFSVRPLCLFCYFIVFIYSLLTVLHSRLENSNQTQISNAEKKWCH